MHIITRSSIDELHDDLCQKKKVQGKLSADLEVFLVSYSKDRGVNITQYREAIFGKPFTSTSDAPEVKIHKEVDDFSPTNADYAKILHDHKTVIGNNLITVVNMIMSHFDRLEGKKVDYVDASTSESASKQPYYGMPYNFYENQSLYMEGFNDSTEWLIFTKSKS